MTVEAFRYFRVGSVIQQLPHLADLLFASEVRIQVRYDGLKNGRAEAGVAVHIDSTAEPEVQHRGFASAVAVILVYILILGGNSIEVRAEFCQEV